MKKTEGRNYSIDFLRFVFSALIVYYHILHANIISYTAGQKLYTALQSASSKAGLIVECFLIIGGYFLYRSVKATANRPFRSFFSDRFFRLWPVFALYVVISFFFLGLSLEDAIYELSFLHCTGISLAYKGIIWYIAPFFVGSIFIAALIRNMKKRPAAILLAVIAFLGYSLNLNYSGGGLGREVAYSFISLGLIRVISGLCIGVLISMYAESVPVREKQGLPASLCWSVVEVLTSAGLINLFVFNKGLFRNSFTAVILFSILFYSFIGTRGYLSRFLNRPAFGFAGKYSYSIYVMQQISFWLLGMTFWKNTDFLYRHTLISIAISVLLSIALGIAVYYLVEKPCWALYKKRRDDRDK